MKEQLRNLKEGIQHETAHPQALRFLCKNPTSRGGLLLNELVAREVLEASQP